jgi:hypothetical protein
MTSLSAIASIIALIIVIQSQRYIKRMDHILNTMKHISRKESSIMADLEALTSQVQENTTVEASAIALLNGLSEQLAAMATDPVAIANLADQLKASADALSAAIVANTPAA